MFTFHFQKRKRSKLLFDLGKSELLVVHIELDVVSSHEDITENPERSSGSGNVETGESEEALSALVENVVLLGESVRVTSDDDVDIGSIGVAVNLVLLVERRNGSDGGSTDRGSDLLHLLCGNREKGRTGIDDGFTSRRDGASGDLDIIHIEGPVSSLSGNGIDNINSVEITGVVIGIDSSDDEFAVRTSASEVESEFVLFQVVRVHESSERCLHSIDGDVIPSHTEDTIELTQTVRESESGGIVDLGEGVVRDGGVTCVGVGWCWLVLVRVGVGSCWCWFAVGVGML